MRGMLTSGATSAVVHAAAFGGLLVLVPSSGDKHARAIDVLILSPSEMSAPESKRVGPPTEAPASTPAQAPHRHLTRGRVSAHVARPQAAANAIPALPSAAIVPAESFVPPAATQASGEDKARVAASSPGAVSGGRASLPPTYLALHYAYIRGAIQRSVSYPVMARRRGWTGHVLLGFRILRSGEVIQVHVVKGSGFEILDAAAMEAVRRASPFPPPPEEAEIEAPVAYSLE